MKLNYVRTLSKAEIVQFHKYFFFFFTFSCYLLLSICRDHWHLHKRCCPVPWVSFTNLQRFWTTHRGVCCHLSAHQEACLAYHHLRVSPASNSWKSLPIMLKHTTHGVKGMKKQLSFFFHIKSHQTNRCRRNTRNTACLSCCVTCHSSACHPAAAFFNGRSPMTKPRQQKQTPAWLSQLTRSAIFKLWFWDSHQSLSADSQKRTQKSRFIHTMK